jgi:glycosyltransferase involved in cell wall biosynthesis
MKIGYDAKRAFFNSSGLGNYSRDTIANLSQQFPNNEYVLYSPKPSQSLPFYYADNLCIKGPDKLNHKIFSSLWRSGGITPQLVTDKINLFHGLSNELPQRIEETQIPSVVTIHDVIFMRYPQFYSAIDRKIYEKKFRESSFAATKVIAVSQQTKDDLIHFFQVPEQKIEVVYQGCNPIFWESAGEGKKNEILLKYLIPDQFMLYVGTIEERKNLLTIVKAIHLHKINYPLVVVGKPTSYLNKVKAYIEKNKIENVYILHNVPSDDLPALYQIAELFIYPSLFEGFGIPILEALVSKTPVISSKGGCFHEAGGKSSIYISPDNVDEMAQEINRVICDQDLREKMQDDGFEYAKQFKRERIAQNIMNVYKMIL